MKKASRILALLLALVLTLGLSVTAFAAEATPTTGTITINNAVSGQTYTIYKILDLESYNADANAYAYKAASAWSDFINGTDVKGVYVNVDNGYVTWIASEEAAAAFAKLAQAYAAEKKLEGEGTTQAASDTVTFTGLPLGYYLVDSTLGTLCALNTTNPSVEIREKNAEPTNEKEVKEDSTGNYGGTNDDDIGKTVEFRSKVTLPKGSQNVTFHDTMDPGLTYTSGSVKVYTDEGLETLLDNRYYEVTESGEDNCTFEVSFTKAYLDGLTEEATVYVTYSAVLNSNAVIGDTGNVNKSKVSYSEKNKTTFTPDSTTTTYTWSFKVLKYHVVGEEKKALAGAKFTLSKSEDGANPIALVKVTDNVYRVAKDGDKDTVTEITTDETGEFTIEGLDSDTYYLTETAAPSGYNKLAGPVKVVIGSDGKINVTEDNPNGEKMIEVENNSGTELPSTGGMGTTVFYVLGGILAVGAVILLVTKKRVERS